MANNLQAGMFRFIRDRLAIYKYSVLGTQLCYELLFAVFPLLTFRGVPSAFASGQTLRLRGRSLVASTSLRMTA